MQSKRDNDNFEKQNSQISFSNKITKRDILSKTKLEFYNEIKKYQSGLKPTKEIEGFGASALVGEKNYPQLKIYNVSTAQRDNSFFNTSDVVKKDYLNIVKLKAKNILGNTNNIYIKNTNSKIIDEIKDVYKARKPVEFTSKFDKELKFNKPIINKLSGVLGTKNELLNINLNENAPTSKQIEKYSSEDIKSREAMIALYEKGINEHQIMNLLSLGNWGLVVNKKMVPTKWAITAYDQTIEKHIYSKIIKYKQIENYEIYHYCDKGNTFVIILIPDTFTFENLEFAPNNWNATDFVKFDNKLKYLDPRTAGGFYSTKVAIFEILNQRKRQASIICLREIDNYEIPLGVVFVRESIRQAMKNKVFSSSDKKELEEFMQRFHKNHFDWYKKSQTLFEEKKQKKLREWF